LDAHDPLFQQIGSVWIKTLTEEFGTDHIYNCDTFNEMLPPSNDSEYLKASSKAVYNAMAGTHWKTFILNFILFPFFFFFFVFLIFFL